MMITSPDNPLIKTVSALKEKKYRDKENLFLAEGIFCVTDIVDISIVDKLFVTEEALKNERVVSFLSRYSEPIIVSDRVMGRISDTVTPQGIVAVIKKPSASFKPTGPCIVLDGIKDPGNAGTIIRTAAAIGYENILSVDGVDLFSPKVVRSTMGGIFRVKVKEYDSVNSLLTDIPQHELYVLDMNGKNIFSFKKNTENYALCVGSEAHGIERTLFEKATQSLCLPMNGNMESLNASVAAGIAMYLLKGKTV